MDKKDFSALTGIRFFAVLLTASIYAYHNKVKFLNKTAFGIALLSFIFPVSIAMFYFGLITEKSRIRNFLSAKPIVLQFLSIVAYKCFEKPIYFLLLRKLGVNFK